MSRRPPAGPDRTEQNRATLKQLVKLEANKSCADCKRNKHPRWASWNIGVFVCIRCSGIHRGMGTHISRVKSVDLDSWTDEQTQAMLRWGNARANRYWESKLAEGHVPNEAKIENFIRTKYDSRRWVMDGPMPDPSTLGDVATDDNVPSSVVRENAVERSTSLRNGSASASGTLPQPPRQRGPQIDLFGDSVDAEPARPSTAEPAVPRPGTLKAPAAAPRQTRPNESLLGLDFFGGSQSAPPARPASTGGGAAAVSGRADLKSSILSLYASKPAVAAAPPQPASNIGAFAGMQSPPATSPTQQSNAQALGGLGDAFGSLSFSSTQPSQVKSAPFSNLASSGGPGTQPIANKSALSGGSFFDAKPAQPTSRVPPPSNPPLVTSQAFGNDFGDFSSGPSPPVTSPTAKTSGMGDLFGFSTPASPPKAPAAPSYATNSAFNLSQKPAPPVPAPAAAQTSSFANTSTMNNLDAWGSNNAWATPDAPAQAPPPPQTSTNSFKPAPSAPVQMGFDSGWGEPAATPAKPTASFKPAPPAPVQSGFDSGWGEPVTSPAKPTASSGMTVQQDEEFGGWSHASPVATTSGPKQGGLGGNQDDLFGNVWE